MRCVDHHADYHEESDEEEEDDEDDDEWIDDDEGEDDDDDEGSNESAWERANGYRADNTVFRYRDLSEGEDDEEDDEEAATTQRQAWFRRHFARIHILRALHDGRMVEDNEEGEMSD